MLLLQKFASYIYSWMRSPQPYPTTALPHRNKDRFLFSVSTINQNQILSQNPEARGKNDNMKEEQMKVTYELAEKEVEDNNEIQNFIMQMTEQERELRKVNQIMGQLEIFESENGNRFNKIESIQQDIRQIHCQISDYSLNYERDIMAIRDTKYSQQLVDYPGITYEMYRRINKYFQNSFNKYEKIKNIYNLQPLPITFKDFKTLAMGSWLNDQIVNNYISLMNDQLIQRKSEYRILHSQFYSMLGKGEKKIKSSLEKQKISQKEIILASIHTSNHWIFIKIQQGVIQIFDSLQKETPAAYENIPTIKMYKIFANWYYGEDHFLQIRHDFPQQNNGYDCGVMMLFGLKDVVRDNINWTFNVNDCKYKRYQLGSEILSAKITGFD